MCLQMLRVLNVFGADKSRHVGGGHNNPFWTAYPTPLPPTNADFSCRLHYKVEEFDLTFPIVLCCCLRIIYLLYYIKHNWKRNKA